MNTFQNMTTHKSPVPSTAVEIPVSSDIRKLLRLGGSNFRPSSPELRKKRTLNRVGFGNIFIKDTGPSNLNKLQY